MSGACLSKRIDFDPASDLRSLRKSPYVATSAEAMRNYKENVAGIWYKDGPDPGFAAQSLPMRALSFQKGKDLLRRT
jgi:hypothetical protein